MKETMVMLLLKELSDQGDHSRELNKNTPVYLICCTDSLDNACFELRICIVRFKFRVLNSVF